MRFFWLFPFAQSFAIRATLSGVWFMPTMLFPHIWRCLVSSLCCRVGQDGCRRQWCFSCPIQHVHSLLAVLYECVMLCGAVRCEHNFTRSAASSWCGRQKVQQQLLEQITQRTRKKGKLKHTLTHTHTLHATLGLCRGAAKGQNYYWTCTGHQKRATERENSAGHNVKWKCHYISENKCGTWWCLPDGCLTWRVRTEKWWHFFTL